MADFQNGLICRIFSVFLERFFAHNNSKWFVEWIFDMIFGILIFDPKWWFCKGYSLCMMGDFQNMLLFLEYLVFFGAVFCTQQLEMLCRIDFDMFFGILIFDPKWWFCKGYSLCMMANIQNGLISRIFSVFWSGFLHTTTRNDLYNGFWHVFWQF